MTTDANAPEDVPLNRWGFIPPWAPLLVMVAVIFTGVVLGEVGTVFVLLFFLTSVVCTALVELRGLFLTVVAVPFWWFIGIGVIGYLADTEAFSGPNRRTAVITAVYPAIEHYLWLLAAFLVSLLVALVRQRLDAAARERARRIARQRRRRTAAAEEDNRRVNSRVRDLERTADRERTAPSSSAPAGSSGSSASSAPSAASAAPSGAASSTTPRTSTPATSRPAPRTVVRPQRPSTPSSGPEVRTRTAEELRAASERRRLRESAREQDDDDRPLDLG